MSVPQSQSNQKDNFGLVIFRWETFRLVFNLVLIGLCLSFTALFDPENFLDPDFWMFLCLGATLANTMFLVGPAVDGYLTWYGIWTAPIAMLMLLCGTILTGYLALNWISQY